MLCDISLALLQAAFVTCLPRRPCSLLFLPARDGDFIVSDPRKGWSSWVGSCSGCSGLFIYQSTLTHPVSEHAPSKHRRRTTTARRDKSVTTGTREIHDTTPSRYERRMTTARPLEQVEKSAAKRCQVSGNAPPEVPTSNDPCSTVETSRERYPTETSSATARPPQVPTSN